MIKDLKRKFIFAAMTAVTILLVVLLGIINVLNLVTSYAQDDRLLAELAATRETVIPEQPTAQPENTDVIPEQPTAQHENTETAPEQPDGKPGDGDDPSSKKRDGPGGIIIPEITEDDKMGAVYFTVSIDIFGTVVDTDISRISSVTEADAEDIAKSVYAEGETDGAYGTFRFVSTVTEQTETVYVFLDVSQTVISIFRLLLLSLAVGLACWGAMLLLVILLSKKAIAPIAGNMERQKNFITDAGHEIKTPLAIIRANTETMEMLQGKNKWTRNIKEQTERLTVLMTNLLTLSKAGDAYYKPSVSEVNISSLLLEYIDMFTEPALNRGLEIDPDIGIGFSAEGDRAMYGQLFSILFDNAVKYAKEGTILKVSAEETEKQTLAFFSNECDELPACDPERLFDRFFRPDSGRSRETGGNGIGLAAAKAIAELYGGRINCRYEGDRIIFTVTLRR